jgi:KamA family protein
MFQSREQSIGSSYASPSIISGLRQQPRWKIYDRETIDQIPQLRYLSSEVIKDIRLATLVFPFKVNEYALDNLIDWGQAPDDPMFRLLFPTGEMLKDADRTRLEKMVDSCASPSEIHNVVTEIRASMNPHPSDQMANVPFYNGQYIKGIQHKYDETVLVFPKQGQTCHSYCSFCFRWPQFVTDVAPKFELIDTGLLHAYLKSQPQVTDLLMTGGDPLVMNTRRLASYLDELTRPEFRHIHTVRLGTKALTYWPYRFLGEDSDELFELFRRLIGEGKHVALMAHVNHWRELEPEPVAEAIAKLKQLGVVIRVQSPLLHHINDSADVWSRNWNKQASLGMIPYYMFVERDTGASDYFGVPLARALSIYQDATKGLSGLAKTARGPVMSGSPGKVHVSGTLTMNGKRYFLLNFLQARKKAWLNQPFLAEYSDTAMWLDSLTPADGAQRFFFKEESRPVLEQKFSEYLDI